MTTSPLSFPQILLSQLPSAKACTVCVCFSVWYVATSACTAFTFLCKARCVLSHSWLWLIGPFRSCEGVGILNCSFLALLFFSLLNCLLFAAPWAAFFFPLGTSIRLRNSHPGKLQQHFVFGFCFVLLKTGHRCLGRWLVRQTQAASVWMLCQQKAKRCTCYLIKLQDALHTGKVGS